jgi:hypothetical protein
VAGKKIVMYQIENVVHADKNKPPHLDPLISSPCPFLVEIVSDMPDNDRERETKRTYQISKIEKKEKKSSRRVVYVRNYQKG